jgi:uncharacterized protein YdaU (DUF1376 family)
VSKTPFMPLWVGDFLAKTGDLDAKEVGAYLLLLMAMWTRDGSLPDDQKKLQRIARIGRDWPKVWGAIGHYFTAKDGRITNDRLAAELSQVRAKREVNAQSGARGGLAKALKDKEMALANATVSPKQSEPESERKEDMGKPISPADKPPDKMRLPEDWVLNEAGWAYARSQGIPDEVIEDEARGFHAYWTDRRDRDAKKSERGWEQTWAGRCRDIAAKYQRRGGMAFQAIPGGHGQGGSLASIAARRRAAGAV